MADKKVPIVCIKKHTGYTYCRRDVDESYEQLFHDAAYAVTHYKDSKVLQACPDCVVECEKQGIGQVQYLAPPATRGLENDK